MRIYKTTFEHRRRRAVAARRVREGKPMMAPRAPVVAHIYWLRDHHVSIIEIARQTNVPEDSLYSMLYQDKARPGGNTHAWYAAQVMKVQGGTAPENTSAQRVLGAQRVYRGLACRGWTMQHLADGVGLSRGNLKNLVSDGKSQIRGISPDSYAELLRVAMKMEMADPKDFLTERQMNTTIGKAKAKGWLDIGVWDYDTVHLADSIPDFTGACGSIQGWRIHHKYEMEYCDPCRKAKKAYDTERRPQ